jgi:CRP-like cAMP-binding protein
MFYKNFDDEIYVVSNSNITEIAVIDYSKIIKGCPNNCPFHNRLVLSLYELLVKDNREQNEKIEMMSKRSVRERIMCFLKKRANENNVFKVTTSYKAIAEYINVDRSNFMRELNKMEQENLIKKEGRTIYLYI